MSKQTTLSAEETANLKITIQLAETVKARIDRQQMRLPVDIALCEPLLDAKICAYSLIRNLTRLTAEHITPTGVHWLYRLMQLNMTGTFRFNDYVLHCAFPEASYNNVWAIYALSGEPTQIGYYDLDRCIWTWIWNSHLFDDISDETVTWLDGPHALGVGHEAK